MITSADILQTFQIKGSKVKVIAKHKVRAVKVRNG